MHPPTEESDNAVFHSRCVMETLLYDELGMEIWSNWDNGEIPLTEGDGKVAGITLQQQL